MISLWLRRLTRRAMREGWRRGVTGGSPGWTFVGAAGVLGWLAIRAMHREPEVVLAEQLQPGQAIRIIHEPPY